MARCDQKKGTTFSCAQLCSAVLRVLTVFLAFLTSPAAAASGVIIVGGDRDYPPYEFIDRDGQPAGYNVDLTRAIADVMGMKVEFRLGGWSEMRRALQEGRIDALQGMSWSEERAGEVGFSLPHTIVNHAVFAAKAGYPVTLLDILMVTMPVSSACWPQRSGVSTAGWIWTRTWRSRNGSRTGNSVNRSMPT